MCDDSAYCSVQVDVWEGNFRAVDLRGCHAVLEQDERCAVAVRNYEAGVHRDVDFDAAVERLPLGVREHEEGPRLLEEVFGLPEAAANSNALEGTLLVKGAEENGVELRVESRRDANAGEVRVDVRQKIAPASNIHIFSDCYVQLRLLTLVIAHPILNYRAIAHTVELHLIHLLYKRTVLHVFDLFTNIE